MPIVVPVKFRFASRDLWFDPMGIDVIEGDHVICKTERGVEIGLATGDVFEVTQAEFTEVCGDAVLRPIVRLATADDLACAEVRADQSDRAMPIFRQLVKESGLDMKPVGVEYLFDASKVVCYFSADERVDFRQLVRDLSSRLHQRIDMRQIGVREEAALVGGFGHCGQELCCARFGHQFEPVSIRMAKEQDLPLNSTKISGACGRLMCCLRYEFEAYRDFKQRAPKRNAVIDTPLGKAKIVEYDTPKEELVLRIENGKTTRVKLADMQTSDASVKKSEELHCPCRPDTVTREALEKLASPDIQMALAEIDRKNGLVPEENFDREDIFVGAPSRHKRTRTLTSAPVAENMTPTTQGIQSAAQDEGGQITPPRKRRRRKPVQTGDSSQHTDASVSPQRATVHRRRRHHSVEGDTPRTLRMPQAESQRTNHHVTNGKHATLQPGAQPGEQTQRRRRRPGDHGGVQAQQTRQDQGQRKRQNAKRRQAQDQRQDQNQRNGQGSYQDRGQRQDQGQARRRSRRHRHSNGHGGTGAPNGESGERGNG